MKTTLDRLMENRIVLPANPMENGTCRPIKRQYQQTSLANFIRGGGHICPTLMHGQSDIYVFEVIRYEHKTR